MEWLFFLESPGIAEPKEEATTLNCLLKVKVLLDLTKGLPLQTALFELSIWKRTWSSDGVDDRTIARNAPTYWIQVVGLPWALVNLGVNFRISCFIANDWRCPLRSIWKWRADHYKFWGSLVRNVFLMLVKLIDLVSPSSNLGWK